MSANLEKVKREARAIKVGLQNKVDETKREEEFARNEKLEFQSTIANLEEDLHSCKQSLSSALQQNTNANNEIKQLQITVQKLTKNAERGDNLLSSLRNRERDLEAEASQNKVCRMLFGPVH